MPQRALVPLDPKRCPDCDALVAPTTVHEPALVRHGGYGATRRTITLHCTETSCDWRMEQEVSEVTPKADAGGFDRKRPRRGW